jgi:hypothetical protein
VALDPCQWFPSCESIVVPKLPNPLEMLAWFGSKLSIGSPGQDYQAIHASPEGFHWHLATC